MSRYATPEAFRQALETRLGTRALDTDIELGRLQRRVVMERVLVRLLADPPGTWVLKGGMAMELLLPLQARMTRDLDLATPGPAIDGDDLTRRLQALVDVDAEGDRFGFVIREARPIDAGEVRRENWRLRLAATLAGRHFLEMHLDVAIEAIAGDAREGRALSNSLDFDGFPAHAVETVTPARHFAEKIHAYTRPRPVENSRSRDLVDMVLLMDTGRVVPDDVAVAVRQVFQGRSEQAAPRELADPPASWAEPYVRMASGVGLAEATTTEAIARVRGLWSEVVLVLGSTSA